MARNDRIICRHPKPKPEDDWFMLDRWTPEAMHVVTVKYRDVLHQGVVTDRIYKAFCQCGWRSIECHAVDAVDRECPVAMALTQRARRKAQDRVMWSEAARE